MSLGSRRRSVRTRTTPGSNKSGRRSRGTKKIITPEKFTALIRAKIAEAPSHLKPYQQETWARTQVLQKFRMRTKRGS